GDRCDNRDRPDLEEDVHDPAAGGDGVRHLRRHRQQLRRDPEEALERRSDLRALFAVLHDVHQDAADRVDNDRDEDRCREPPAELRVLFGVPLNEALELAAKVGEERHREGRQSILSTNTNEPSTAASPAATARGGISDSIASRPRMSTAAPSLTEAPRRCDPRTVTSRGAINDSRKTTAPPRNATLAPAPSRA